jgi:DNA-binding NtrC family response regulator
MSSMSVGDRDAVNNILFVCSYSKAFQTLRDALCRRNFVPIVAFTLREARDAIATCSLKGVICASQFIDGDYRNLLAACQSIQPHALVFVISPSADENEREQAIKLGAAGLITRPSSDEESLRLLDDVLRRFAAGQQPENRVKLQPQA